MNDAKIRTKRSADGSKGDGGHVMEFQNVTYIHQNPTDKNVKDYSKNINSFILHLHVSHKNALANIFIYSFSINTGKRHAKAKT